MSSSRMCPATGSLPLPPTSLAKPQPPPPQYILRSKPASVTCLLAVGKHPDKGDLKGKGSFRLTVRGSMSIAYRGGEAMAAGA